MTACYAGERERGARIDPHDASVRHGTPVNLAGEHPGQAQVMDVLGGARHLGVSLEAADGLTDAHTGPLFPEACHAPLSARRVCTRTISRL